MPRDQATPPRYEDLPDMCTVEDVQLFLQLGRNTVYELVKAGEIPSKKFGKHIRIPKTALLGNGNGHQ